MRRSKERGKKNNNQSVNNPEEASTKAQEISKASNVYVCDSPELYKPQWHRQPSLDSSYNVSEKKENKGNIKPAGALHAIMGISATNKGVTANESKKTTTKDSENSTCGNDSVGNPKKKRRRRGKSTLDTLVSKPTVQDKDTDRKSGIENKALDCRELIFHRIAQLESKQPGPNPLTRKNLNLMMAGNKDGPQVTSTKKELHLFPLNNCISVGSKDSKTGSWNVPVIFMMDVTTQTDPVPEPSINSKSTYGKSSTTLNSGSDSSIVTKPIVQTLPLSVAATNAENVSGRTETSQSKVSSYSNLSSPDGKNADGAAITKPRDQVLLLPAETTSPENVEKRTETSRNKISSCSNLSSPNIINSTTLNSGSDGSAINKSRKQNLLLPVKETNPENVTEHTDSSHNKIISYSNLSSPGGKNSTILNFDSDSLIITKPTAQSLPLQVEETNPENVSKHTGTFQKKINSCSNLSSLDENLQIITEDFLRNVKILSENFKDNFMKCLKPDE